MKKYYAVFGEFSNQYSLLYVENEGDAKALPEGAERITRKQAINLARKERERAKFDSSFSGYADDSVYPALLPEDYDIRNSKRYELVGYIWERI